MENLKTEYSENMKVSEETFNQLKKDYQKVYDSLTEEKRELFNSYLKSGKIKLVWDIWHKICRDKRHKKELNIKNRIFEFDRDFELYPDGTNDKTLETALIRAFNNLLIDNKQET